MDIKQERDEKRERKKLKISKEKIAWYFLTAGNINVKDNRS